MLKIEKAFLKMTQNPDTMKVNTDKLDDLNTQYEISIWKRFHKDKTKTEMGEIPVI